MDFGLLIPKLFDILWTQEKLHEIMGRTTGLFTDFSAISKEEWLAKVEKDLKGKPLADLEWQLEEGIRVQPFYTRKDAPASVPMTEGRTNNDWAIGEDVLVKDEVAANKQLLQALECGVQAPRLVLEATCDWTRLLEGVHLEMISLHILDKNGLGDALLEGLAVEDLEGSIQSTAVITRGGAAFKTLTVDGTRFFATPKETSTELAQLIFSAEQQLAESNDIATCHANLQFSVAVGTSYFVEIAKLRALKLLWANVLKAYGLSELEMPPITAHCAAAAYGDDMYTNMVRATTMGLSAVVGGVQCLTILPANAHQEVASDFTRRIARNVQHLLKLESYLNRVVDPAAGSYYIEQLTQKLATEAWAKFQAL